MTVVGLSSPWEGVIVPPPRQVLLCSFPRQRFLSSDLPLFTSPLLTSYLHLTAGNSLCLRSHGRLRHG